MGKFKKSLQYSRKLEELQIERRAKEVGDVKKLDIQAEADKHQKLNRMLEFERQNAGRVRQNLETAFSMELDQFKNTAQTLEEIETFEIPILDTELNALESEPDVIDGLQGDACEKQRRHAQKQLPSSSIDAFTHELTGLTEMQLQRELEGNKAEIENGRKIGNGRNSRKKSVMPRQQESQSKEIIDIQAETERTEEVFEKEQTSGEKGSGNVLFFKVPYTPPERR